MRYKGYFYPEDERHGPFFCEADAPLVALRDLVTRTAGTEYKINTKQVSRTDQGGLVLSDKQKWAVTPVGTSLPEELEEDYR